MRLSRKSRCECYACSGSDTPREGDFCVCGGTFVHERLDSRLPRKCPWCGRRPSKETTAA